MRYDDYSVLLADPELGAGPAARTLAARLAARGLSVIAARDPEHLRSLLAVDSRVAVALLNCDLFGSWAEVRAVLDDIHQLSVQLPVVMLSEQPDEQSVPAVVAERTEDFFWLHADSPHFVAGQVERLVRTRATQPAPSG